MDSDVAADQRGFRGVLVRHDHPAAAFRPRAHRNRQDARNGPHFAVQRQLADQKPIVEIGAIDLTSRG